MHTQWMWLSNATTVIRKERPLSRRVSASCYFKQGFLDEMRSRRFGMAVLNMASPFYVPSRRPFRAELAAIEQRCFCLRSQPKAYLN